MERTVTTVEFDFTNHFGTPHATKVDDLIRIDLIRTTSVTHMRGSAKKPQRFDIF